MPVWERRTLRIRRVVWAVKSPAHVTDVAEATVAAETARAVAVRDGRTVGDVYVSSVDDEVHVWFEADEAARPTPAAFDEAVRDHVGGTAPGADGVSAFAPYMVKLIPFVHPDMGHAVVVLTCVECPEPTVIARYAEPHEPTVFEILASSHHHWQKEHG